MKTSGVEAEVQVHYQKFALLKIQSKSLNEYR